MLDLALDSDHIEPVESRPNSNLFLKFNVGRVLSPSARLLLYIFLNTPTDESHANPKIFNINIYRIWLNKLLLGMNHNQTKYILCS